MKQSPSLCEAVVMQETVMARHHHPKRFPEYEKKSKQKAHNWTPYLKIRMGAVE